MRRIIYLSLLISLMFLACNSDNEKQNVFPSIQETSFIWKGDSLGSYYCTHSGMLLPVVFDKITGANIFINLETGYNNTAVFEDYANEIGILSTDSISGLYNSVSDVSGSIGEIAFGPCSFPVSHRIYAKEDSIVGNVTFDFFDKQELLIDFKNGIVSVADSIKLPEGVEKVEYEIYLGKKILIPIKMNEDTLMFLLNPQSELYVALNINKPTGSLFIGNQKFVEPNSRTVDDVNPAFDGILGYAFLKDKILWINPAQKKLCILDKIAE